MKISSRSSKVASLIYERTPFETYGALWATDSKDTSGELPSEWRELFHAQTKYPTPVYIVYSYQTPIAWWSEALGWVIPPVKYSRTTSVHQGKLYRVSLIPSHLKRIKGS